MPLQERVVEVCVCVPQLSITELNRDFGRYWGAVCRLFATPRTTLAPTIKQVQKLRPNSLLFASIYAIVEERGEACVRMCATAEHNRAQPRLWGHYWGTFHRLLDPISTHHQTRTKALAQFCATFVTVWIDTPKLTPLPSVEHSRFSLKHNSGLLLSESVSL